MDVHNMRVSGKCNVNDGKVMTYESYQFRIKCRLGIRFSVNCRLGIQFNIKCRLHLSH
jgi:hypothetical protein